MTLNQDILSVVKSYTIPINKIPFQQKIPNFTKMNKKQIALLDLELKGDVEGRDNKKNSTCPAQLVQPVQLTPCREKVGGYRPVMNLKMMNQFISFLHFKMKCFSKLKHLLLEGDWM